MRTRFWIGPVVAVAAAAPAFAVPTAQHLLGGKVAKAEGGIGSQDTPSLLSRLESRATSTTPPINGIDLTKMSFDDAGVTTTPLPDKKVAKLWIDPQLQRTAQSLMAVHHLPEAAVVMMDVQSGHVLAYASHLEKGPARDLCVEATAPAASVFKIVTGGALVELASVSPDVKECYSGGEQRIMPQDLEPDPKRDKWCTTLAGAMGRSINTVFARLVQRSLKPNQLEEFAKGFGFGAALPFDVPVQASSLHIPDEPLAFARTAAGFWNTTLSPMHAVTLSATVARGGEMVRPQIVSAVTSGSDTVYSAREAPAVRRTMKAETAQAVTAMMDHTVAEGTSYRAFHDQKGQSFLPNIQVAGKTGTLTDAQAQRYYTWFTGFAPSHPQPGQRQVAIAVLVVNQAVWHVKANTVAREMLRAYFAGQRAPGVTPPTLRASTTREASAGNSAAPAAKAR